MALDLAALKDFEFERLLNEDPATHSLTLLGSFPGPVNRSPGIIRIEKTSLPSESAPEILSRILEQVRQIGHTDIYTWLFGWLQSQEDHPDVKINVIHPATEVHIRKYTKQEILMVHETPAIYERIVRPYINSFPPSRTQWVQNILSGKSEADKIFYRDPSPDFGFIILPDMKWDLKTISSLYLVAIVSSSGIRSLRDLKKVHLEMLRNIRQHASRAVKERWGLSKGSLRLFVHYQPSYYHFHVHIVNANQSGYLGMVVGQAHLLDDIISLLELDSDDGHSIFERITLTYGLGDQHGLYALMKTAQDDLDE